MNQAAAVVFQTPVRLRRAELAARLTAARRAVAQAFGSRRPTLIIGPSAECGRGSLIVVCVCHYFSFDSACEQEITSAKFAGQFGGIFLNFWQENYAPFPARNFPSIARLVGKFPAWGNTKNGMPKPSNGWNSHPDTRIRPSIFAGGLTV